MTNWKTETARYIARLETALSDISVVPQIPNQIPSLPLEHPVSLLQTGLIKATSSYRIGIWIRTHETLEAIVYLWRAGYIAQAVSLIRLLFEVWGISYFQTEALKSFAGNKDVNKLFTVVNKIQQGVRSEVMLPWGAPATETPIHVMDTMRLLTNIYPQALTIYEDLCESTHANQPKYFILWLLGKAGDNWINDTCKKHGHIMLDSNVSALETCVSGIKSTTNEGLDLCGQLY